MDRFGFVGEHSCVESKEEDSNGATVRRVLTPTEKKAAKHACRLENKRSLKWLKMCENWPVWCTKHHKVVKRRVRKGVPDAMRGKMWEVFSGADILRQRAAKRNENYAATVEQANAKFARIKTLMDKANDINRDGNAAAAAAAKTNGGGGKSDDQQQQPAGGARSQAEDPLALLSIEQKRSRKWDIVIEADLGRTFPDHCMFHRAAMGQTVLRDVLRGYALLHPELGYTQGMNFIAAMFISYMPARDAYWMLTAVMDSPKWDLQSMFCDRTPAVSRIWYQFDKLLAKYVPKVSAHFKKEGMDHSMYLTKWVIPLFTRDFHFDFVARIWDIFLHQGWKIVLRVALALLKQRETALLSMDMEKIMYYLRDLPSTVDAEATLKLAHRIKFKTQELEDLRLEFENQ